MPNSSITCVDANIAFRFAAEPTNEAVQHVWGRWRRDQRTLAAPSLLRYEVTNAVHRFARAQRLDEAEAQRILHVVLALPIRLENEAGLHPRALEIADRFDLPAAYDAHYLALADRLGAEFWTADQRLANKVRHALAWVHLVGE